MGKHSIAALCILASLRLASIEAAAQTPRPTSGTAVPPHSDLASLTPDSGSQRLLTRSEGRALVDMALSQAPPADDQPDCSHLINQIFAVAGLDYPYKTSFELYAGIPEFQQVRSPQPGDLIVWRGHVGLVVDPSEHSFYSALDSGLLTQQYDADYWQRRGRHRFYRYVVGSQTEIAALQKPQPLITRATASANSVKRITDDAEPQSSVSSEPLRPSTRVSTRDRSDQLATPFQLPEDISISSWDSNPDAKPTAKDVAEAITELASESAAVLKSGDFAGLAQPVIIFDQLRVEKVELKREKGWAQIRVDYRVALNRQQVESRHRNEKQRWELRRTDEGWVALIPQDRVYVPVAAATRIISECLYTLSKKNSANTRTQQASLAHLLDAVFNAGD
jgi:hypothetical protein